VIGRKKVVRKVQSIAANGQVIDLPPSWHYTIICQHHGQIEFDFRPLCRNEREDLASHFRDAIWSLRHELIGLTLRGILDQTSMYFWPFLDDLEHTGMAITRLYQLDDKVIKAYLAWLETRIARGGKSKGRPLSLATRKNAYTVVKSVLVNRQKKVPACVSPLLKFPKSPFPNINRLVPKREPYSKEEQERIIAACNKDLRMIHESDGTVLSPAQILAVHLILFALATGKNFQGLLELRRDSLKPHPLKDREILITEKRRSSSPQISSYPANAPEQVTNQEQVLTVPTTIGDHFKWLAQYTRPLMDKVSTEDQDYVFLWLVPYTGRHPQSTRQGLVNRFTPIDARNAIADFRQRHRLLDDHGAPLRVSIARCRPTFGTNLYVRTRDIRKVQIALGHGSAETTARHYVSLPIEAERDHVFVGQAMVGWVTSSDEEKAKVLAADGKVPLDNVRELLRGGYNTVVARCRNPFRENGEVCGKYMACFKCPQMVVFEDDLWRLYSFYFRLLSERNKIAPHHWMKTYGWVIKTIDNDIATQFEAAIVEDAIRKAKDAPHPAWAMHNQVNE
jgi:integrase